MQIPAIPYLPLPGQASNLPLQRFIPPYSKGLISLWLDAKIPKGQWLIDPLGANPLLDIEAAQQGYKVLTARSNPIVRLMLEVLAGTPSVDEFRSVLMRLFTPTTGTENLEENLQSLYLTHCRNCNNQVMAQGFIWERGHDRPKSRVYTCPKCGDEGEQVVSQFDLEKLDAIKKQANKHCSRARQRITVGLQSGFYGLEEALDCYQARSLTFIMTLINKLEGADLPKAQEQLAMALILSVMDYGNNLWPWPLKPYRPLTLTTPALYFEHNLWLTLQTSIQEWVQASESAVVTRWPEVKDDGGEICFFQRNKSELEAIGVLAKPQGVITIFPHPNQAFLTFSALWSGWLWGPDAVRSVHGALERRRYDWHWLTGMLEQIFRPVQSALMENTPFFGLAPDPTAANLYAIIAAARNCQFSFTGISYRQDDHLFQLEWNNSPQKKMDACTPNNLHFKETIQEAIKARGEPLTYAEIQFLCLIEHALVSKLSDQRQGQGEDELNPTLIEIKKIVQNINFLKPLKAMHFAQGSQWWLVQDQSVQPPLAEQIEARILEVLREKKIVHMQDLDRQICAQFPGFLTPSFDLVKAILDSYTESILDAPDTHQMLHEDKKESRLQDKKLFITELTKIGKGFGYQITGDHPLLWIDKNQKPISIFYFLETIEFYSKLNMMAATHPENRYFVFPGSRSQLIIYRLRRDLHLKEEIESHWHFLKLRQLHQLTLQNELTPIMWNDFIKNDPPLWDPPEQLTIF